MSFGSELVGQRYEQWIAVDDFSPEQPLVIALRRGRIGQIAQLHDESNDQGRMAQREQQARNSQNETVSARDVGLHPSGKVPVRPASGPIDPQSSP